MVYSISAPRNGTSGCFQEASSKSTSGIIILKVETKLQLIQKKNFKPSIDFLKSLKNTSKFSVHKVVAALFIIILFNCSQREIYSLLEVQTQIFLYLLVLNSSSVIFLSNNIQSNLEDHFLHD